MRVKLLLCVALVAIVISVCEGGRSSSSGRSSSRSSSRSYGGGHSSGSKSYWASSASKPKPSSSSSNNWQKARDRVSSQNKPNQQPNHDHTKLSYGNHEPHGASTSHVNPKPKHDPNLEHTKLSYGEHATPNKPIAANNDHKPSAPPMETHNKPANHNPSAPPQEPNKAITSSGDHNVATPHKPVEQQLSAQQTSVNNHHPSAPPSNNPSISSGAPAAGWAIPGATGVNHPPQGGTGNNPTNPGAPKAGWAIPPPTDQHSGIANHQTINPGAPQQTNHMTSTNIGTQQGIHSQHVNPNQNYPQQPPPPYPQQPNYPTYPNQPHNNYPQQPYHPQQPNYPQQPYYPQHNTYTQNNHYSGYHPYPAQNGYNYHPPAANVHYGPVTIINGHSTPSYSYYHDTSDNTLLSMYVGYKIGSMFSHSNYHHSHSYTDHTYVVHHYHSDKQTVPEKVTVAANTIVSCGENVTLLCVSNAYPVCMSNGTIMCVTNPQLTTPCKEYSNLTCVDTTIDCSNNSTPPCNSTNSNQNTTTLSIPCVSSVSIFGDLSLLQNVINSTQTMQNVTATNTTVMDAGGNNTVTTSGGNDTVIVATSGNNTVTVSSNTTAGVNSGMSNTIFCVTVIAVPTPINLTQPSSTANPLDHPAVQEKGWDFFGKILNHVWSG